MKLNAIPTEVVEKFRTLADRFTPPPAARASRLLTLKGEIAALRSKGASYRTIAELLHQCGIKVSDTCVFRFCRRNLSQASPLSPKPSHSKAPKRNPSQAPDAAKPAAKRDASVILSPRASSDSSQPSPQKPGPRIAQIQFASPNDP